MSYMAVDPIAGRRGVIERATKDFSRRAYEFLDPAEKCAFYVDQIRIGVYVGIQSVRARHLLKSLEKDMFRGFQAHEFRNENGMLWARFGYY